MSIAPIDLFDELPRVDGPKLGRFNGGNYKRIEYLELLGRSSDQGQYTIGDHGYVFKVRIDGELYALKVASLRIPITRYKLTVVSFDSMTYRKPLTMLDPAGRSCVSQIDVEGQCDPFYAECRAYGRIASKPRKRPIAIACYGFIGIPAEQESFFAERFNVTDWNRPEGELSLGSANRQPFRALVKEFATEDPEITKGLAASMWRDLTALHGQGIYVMDVRWDNYKRGHLVDFSSAWTSPYFQFRRDVSSEEEIRMYKEIDLEAFNLMVEEELGMGVSARIELNKAVVERLRPRRKEE